jgi:hypothetical protein
MADGGKYIIEGSETRRSANKIAQPQQNMEQE